MEKITDWNALWRDLVEIKVKSREKRPGWHPRTDVWADRATHFKEHVKRRWTKPDSSREFILSQIQSDATVLDIGAGTGDWSILLSRRAKHVTAIEPSNAMIGVMKESLALEKIKNISVVHGSWPDVSVEPHDFSLCSHAMYGYPDLAAFVLRMVACLGRHRHGQADHRQQSECQRAKERGEIQSRKSAHGAVSSSEHRVRSGPGPRPPRGIRRGPGP